MHPCTVAIQVGIRYMPSHGSSSRSWVGSWNVTMPSGSRINTADTIPWNRSKWIATARLHGM